MSPSTDEPQRKLREMELQVNEIQIIDFLYLQLIFFFTYGDMVIV